MSKRYLLKKSQKGFLITIFVVILFLILRIYVFDTGEENVFIGSWKDSTGQSYHFKKNFFSNPVEITIGGMTIDGSWYIENDVLYMNMKLDDQTDISYKYTYSVEEDKIILKPYGGSGLTVTLTKI